GGGASLAGSPAVTRDEIPEHAWAFFAGQPPKVLKNFPFFPVLPRSILMTIHGTRKVQARYQGTFADAGAASAFAKNLMQWKQVGLLFMEIPPVSNYPKASERLTRALNGMEINAQKDRVRGGFQVPGETMDDLVEITREMDPSWINRGIDE